MIAVTAGGVRAHARAATRGWLIGKPTFLSLYRNSDPKVRRTEHGLRAIKIIDGAWIEIIDGFRSI